MEYDLVYAARAVSVGANPIQRVHLNRSADGGLLWELVENSPSLVISLAEWNGRFYAGTAEDGLWLSDERAPHGQFWQRVN